MKLTVRHIAPFLGLIFLVGLASLLLSTSPAIAEMAFVSPLPPVTGVDSFAGVCYAHYYGPGNRPFLSLTHNAGARHDRVDFRWDSIRTNGYSGYDSLVDDELSAGIDLIGILMATPAEFRQPGCDPTAGLGSAASVSPGQRPPGWYIPETGGVSILAIAGSDPGACPPTGLYNTWTVDNFNGNHWAEYVYTTVLRYENRVKYWEMWNEVEWSWFWMGTDAEYAQLLKVGYQATKAACPDCTVLFAGLHYWADPTFFERVLDILNDDSAASANNYFFDVMSVHLYSRSSNTYDVVNHIRSRMNVHVPAHPIWLTETGVSVYDGDYPGERFEYSAAETEAAAYLIQSYANAIAAGVERYHWFRVHDDVMSKHFGLTHDENYLRPAYVAYQVAATYLISPTFTTRVPTGSHLRVTLWGTPRGKASVLWNASPTAGDYVLPATIETATLVDRLGVTQTIGAVGGFYVITLPGATANLVSNPSDYIIGGDPLILIESETVNEPPTSTVHSLPTITYSPTFTVTWEGHDNESGVWLYDVQVRDGAGGGWSYLRHSTTTTSTQFVGGQHGHTYYFRSRAMDHVGNRADWPENPQAHTTFDLVSTLHLNIGAFFADENRDDVWNKPITETDEITLTQVTLRLLDETGADVITPTVGSMAEFTTTIYAGEAYRLLATSTERSSGEREVYHERVLSFTWSQYQQTYTETYNVLGLWRTERVYLPLIMRNG